ncbi:MAG: aldo/keto reductase [Saprospiraceae bacterium]
MEKSWNKISRREAAKWISLGASSLLASPFFNAQKNKTLALMNTRKIISSGKMLPVIGVGTWQSFDVGENPAERNPLKEVLKILIEHGGSVIDSSPMYGRSEKVVGELTAELEIKNKIFEATKVWTTGKEEGIDQMYTSMNLMGAHPMDLMQIHNLVDWKTHLKTLQKWKEEEKVRNIGITHYHKGGYAEMEKIMKTENIDFIQINYNLAVRDAAERILPLAKDKGIAVLINRPYEGGSLFKKMKGKEIPTWAKEFEAESWGQIFLKFILAHPAVNCVIPGTSKVKHMKDNVQAGFGKYPNQTMQKRLIDLM